MTVKKWQLGYNATTGNFEELDDIAAADPNDPRVIAFENQITAIMEQKGLLASQAQQYIANAYAQGTTLDALKHTSVQTGTAEERGDVWGASDDSSGKSFLAAQADRTDVQSLGNSAQNAQHLINQLYTEGFGREADAEGLAYWSNALTSGSMSYADIAKSFGASEEAQIRDVYHQEYGRDADDAGLQYWLSQDDGVGHATRVIQDATTAETQIRNLHGTHLGQFSTEAERQANIAAGGFWTDAQEGGYANLNWSQYDEGDANLWNPDGTWKGTAVQQAGDQFEYDFGSDHDKNPNYNDPNQQHSAYMYGDQYEGEFKTGLDQGLGIDDGTNKTGVERFRASIEGEQDATSSFSGNTISSIDDVRNILQRRENLMNISSTYDVDDAEGGSGIGRIFTLAEMEPYMYEAAEEDGTLKTLAEKLGAEKWALLTKELDKTFKSFDEAGYTGNLITNPGVNPDQRRTNRNTLSNEYQVPVPPDYQGPDKANVTREDIEYMPPKDGTVPDRNIRPLDSSYTPAPQQAVRNQGAFVAGTSAQGVRRRQSSAARSGRSAMGTKQLARNNMQIKSLNI